MAQHQRVRTRSAPWPVPKNAADPFEQVERIGALLLLWLRIAAEQA